MPGITMNMGKTGSSFSFGPRGAKVTVGKNGIRKTVGIPGTGLSYTTYNRYNNRQPTQPSGTSTRTASTTAPQPFQSASGYIDAGAFGGLFLSANEKKFVAGVKALMSGNSREAEVQLAQLPEVTDAEFVLAIIYFNAGDIAKSRHALENVVRNVQSLGVLFRKFKISMDLSFPITEVVSVNLAPTALAVDLLRVEVFQRSGEIANACNILLEWYKRDNSNLLVKISLAELVLSTSPTSDQWLRTLLTMTEKIENDTPVHTALLLYRSMVFKQLKLYDCAQNVLSVISRKKKDRDAGLLVAIQEERAEIYELQGRNTEARRIWERLYAEDPSNTTAARKLNLL